MKRNRKGILNTENYNTLIITQLPKENYYEKGVYVYVENNNGFYIT